MTRLRPAPTLIVLAIAELLAMSCWFSGTAVMPELSRAWGAGLAITSWLTLAVQLGFVAGALISATFNLADVISAPRLVIAAMLATAAANAGFAYAATASITAAVALRFATGVALAGAYPPAMKIIAGWFRLRRGLALGTLVGALGVGSAMPHLLRAIGAITAANWRHVVLVCSVQAVAGALLVAAFVRDGPFAAPAQRFDLSQAGQIFRNRPLALANFGYFGHMWELYAWWGWIAVIFARSSVADAARTGALGWSSARIETWSFVAMAMGAIGCVLAGIYSDRSPDEPAARIGQRSQATIVAMALSGGSCVATWLLFDRVDVVAAIALVWGLSVAADSAQFSAVISEVCDPRYVGTALTLQTALGFLLTVLSIRVTGWVGEQFGWSWACLSMAIGPAFGIAAMGTLKKHIRLP